MIQDVAHRAYQAARTDDRGAVLAAVAEIVASGNHAIDTAVRTWMDRTIITTGMDVPAGAVNINMVADHSPTGEPEAMDKLMAEIAWAGRLFAAYITGDAEQWEQLWGAVPDSQLTRHVQRVLTTMVKTALAYEEEIEPGACCTCHTCRTWHTWLHGDPEATGARLAVAHLN